MTVLAMLVFGIVLAVAFTVGDSAAAPAPILIAFAGFITLLVGIGRRREKPVT